MIESVPKERETDCLAAVADSQTHRLVHTHVWTVEVPLDRLPLGCAPQLRFESPAFSNPALLSLTEPCVELMIGVDHTNGHQLRIVPPSSTENNVTFHTTLTTMRMMPDDDDDEDTATATTATTTTTTDHQLHSKVHGRLTAYVTETPALRAHPLAAVVSLRHCAVYHSRPNIWRCAVPRRTWHRSVLQPPTVLHRSQPLLRLPEPNVESFVTDICLPHNTKAVWYLALKRTQFVSFSDDDDPNDSGIIEDFLDLKIGQTDNFLMCPKTPLLLDLHSVEPPHVGMLVDVYFQFGDFGNEYRITDAELLKRMNAGDRFECSLSTQRMQLLTTDCPPAWDCELASLRRYRTDMVALHDTQRLAIGGYDLRLQLVDKLQDCDSRQPDRRLPAHRALVFQHVTALRTVIAMIPKRRIDGVVVLKELERHTLLWPVLVRALYMGSIESNANCCDVLDMLSIAERMKSDTLTEVCLLWLATKLPKDEFYRIRSQFERFGIEMGSNFYSRFAHEYTILLKTQPAGTEWWRLQHSVRQLQDIYRPLIDNSAKCDMQWLANGQKYSVHTFVLDARAPALLQFLRRKHRKHRQPLSACDVSGLGLSPVGVMRLLGHIYCGDELEDGDDALQLLAVAKLAQLEFLARSAHLCLVQELAVAERAKGERWIRRETKKAMTSMLMWKANIQRNV